MPCVIRQSHDGLAGRRVYIRESNTKRGVLVLLRQLRRKLQGREILWYVDNTVVWRSLVKGMLVEVYISRTVGPCTSL